MTIIKNPNQNGNLDIKRLRKFEKELLVCLPDDYKSFLAKSNGGKPYPSEFWVEYPKNASEVYIFYGLYNEPKWESLDYLFHAGLHIPTNLTAIGDDGVGNYICMRIDNIKFGSVYFIDHELYDHNNPSSPEGITFIADSFQDFFDNLQDMDRL